MAADEVHNLAEISERSARDIRRIAKTFAEQSKALVEINSASQELSEMPKELKTSTNIAETGQKT